VATILNDFPENQLPKFYQIDMAPPYIGMALPY